MRQRSSGDLRNGMKLATSRVPSIFFDRGTIVPILPFGKCHTRTNVLARLLAHATPSSSSSFLDSVTADYFFLPAKNRNGNRAEKEKEEK